MFDLFILPELEILYASATLLLIIYNYLLDPELKHARNLEAQMTTITVTPLDYK